MTQAPTPLDRVYAARTSDELASAYADWASGYDRETVELGYCLPFVIGGFVARHVARGDGPLLDAGCGTGLSGPVMRALGYGAIDGMDFSEEMLRLARNRGGYSECVRATLGEVLPWQDGRFAAVFSTGVFTEGHAPASSLDELVRIVRPGGHVILTVRDTVLLRDGFATKFEELERAVRWSRIEESPPFRAFALAEPHVLVQAFVFRIVA